jgi:ABC-type lipoprotein export system ATPase subunit
MDPEVIIMVMGPTGSGKSTFVRLVTGDQTIRVGSGLSPGKTLLCISQKYGIREQALKHYSHGSSGPQSLPIPAYQIRNC